MYFHSFPQGGERANDRLMDAPIFANNRTIMDKIASGALPAPEDTRIPTRELPVYGKDVGAAILSHLGSSYQLNGIGGAYGAGDNAPPEKPASDAVVVEFTPAPAAAIADSPAVAA